MPAVLYGMDVMNVIPKKTMKQLIDLNNRALKAITGVGKYGCPLPALYLELACWTVPNQILYEQIMFTFHVACQSEGSLAKDFYDRQIEAKLEDSIILSCLETLETWNITEIQRYSKWQFKLIIRKRISIKNAEDLFSWAKDYKKIKLENYNQDLKMQDYFKELSLAKARLIFRQNCGFLRTI